MLEATRRRPPALILWLLLSANAPILGFSSRAYPLGCSREDPSYYDYENYPFPPPQVPLKSTMDYNIIARLGNGKFSDVFSAIEVPSGSVAPPLDGIDPKSLVVIKVSNAS